MHDVFSAVGSARHHKECGGHQWPKREAEEFFPVGDCCERLGVLCLLTRGASCCQFLWLPPQATHSHHRVSPGPEKQDVFSRGSRVTAISQAFSAKLVRTSEITGIFH